jgi:hypothetical protein
MCNIRRLSGRDKPVRTTSDGCPFVPCWGTNVVPYVPRDAQISP